MATRKNKVVCPYCGSEKRFRTVFGGEGYAVGCLTAREYPSEKATVTCDACGRKYEVRAEECVFYKTRKVD